MALVDVLRAIGAALGFVGALVLAPGAVQNLWAEGVRPAVNSGLQRLGIPGRNIHRELSDSVNIPGSASIAWAAAGWASITSSDGSVEQEFKALQEKVRQIEDRLGKELQDVRAKLDEYVQSCREASDIQTQAVIDLKAELETLDQRTVRINSAALPIIGIAFLLGGFPEPWVNVFSFVLLLVVAIAFSGPALRRAVKVSRRTR